MFPFVYASLMHVHMYQVQMAHVHECVATMFVLRTYVHVCTCMHVRMWTMHAHTAWLLKKILKAQSTYIKHKHVHTRCK